MEGPREEEDRANIAHESFGCQANATRSLLVMWGAIVGMVSRWWVFVGAREIARDVINCRQFRGDCEETNNGRGLQPA